jgi:hypothetical protein
MWKRDEDYIREALVAARDKAGGSADTAVRAFLEYLNEHYVGDMYIESSVNMLLVDLRAIVAGA